MFVFALLPTRRTSVNHDVVRSMHDRQASRVARLVFERDRRRLVVKLQYIRVVLHLINEGKLNTVAFKLDRHAHLSAGIAAAHILPSPADPPCGTSRPTLRNRGLRFPRQAQPSTP